VLINLAVLITISLLTGNAVGYPLKLGISDDLLRVWRVQKTLEMGYPTEGNRMNFRETGCILFGMTVGEILCLLIRCNLI
jgi:hypothetical protein